MEPEWLSFQRQVAELARSRVDGDTTVDHDVKLVGSSGVERQIDVLVRYQIGSLARGTVVVDAKRHERPIAITHVEAFENMVRDLRAQHGILFARSGYTDGAEKRAEQFHNVDLQIVTEDQLATWRPRLVHLACWECGLMTAYKYKAAEAAPEPGQGARACPCGEGLLEVAAVTERSPD